MGILDFLGTGVEDPRFQASNAMAQSLLGRGGGMQRLAGGLGNYGSVMEVLRNQELKRKLAEAQISETEAQAENRRQLSIAAQRKLAQEQAVQDAFKRAYKSPEQQAMGSLGGPTNAAAAAVPRLSGQFDQQALIRELMQADPVLAFEMSKPKEKKLTSLAPGATLYDPEARAAVFTAPDKEKESDPNKPFMMVGGKIVPNPAYQDYAKALAAAGSAKTNVSVNTGQRGFDNTLKLRSDFRSEPIYKAHNEVQSAYAQIQQSLKQQSPAGDLAGATKIMKLLDPGSVVRESELGMAMSATGLADRIQNYAQMTLSGTKLTPSQRKDFQSLADKLYAESGKLYNSKRGEYKGIADRNELPSLDVIGPEVKIPKIAIRTGIDPLGRKVVEYSDGSISHAD